MQVDVDIDGSIVNFVFTSEENDPLSNWDRTKWAGRTAGRICLSYEPAFVHPDLLGLAAVILCGEYAHRVFLNWEVSDKFLRSARLYRKKKQPVEGLVGKVSPRVRPKEPIPALGFSGGVDSFAALQLLPDNAECYFLARVRPSDDNRDYYKKSASGVLSTLYLQSKGRVAFAVPSDVEHLRDPIGLTDHLVIALPMILMADERNLGSVSWGTIAEAAYRFGMNDFVEVKDRIHFTRHFPIFEAVGLPIHQPVVGLSEAMTTRIFDSSEHAGRSISCIYEGVEPCGKCIKCARKLLLSAAVSAEWPSDDQIHSVFASKTVRNRMFELPIQLENVYGYIAQHYTGDSPVMAVLAKRMRADRYNFSWMNRYFTSSTQFMPEDLKAYSVPKIRDFADPISEDDMREIRRFALEDVANDQEMQRVHRQWRAVMKECASIS